MDTNLEEKIIKNRASLNKEIKPSTVKMYISNVKKLSKTMNDGVETGGFEWLKDLNKVKSKLEEPRPNGKPLHFSSIRNYMNSAIMYLYAINEEGNTDDLIREYSDIRDKLNQQYDDSVATGTYSSNQEKNVITMEELQKVITDIGTELKDMKLKSLDKINTRQRSLLQIYLILNVHILMPFRNDLGGMIVSNKRDFNKITLEEKKKHNYLVLERNGKSMFFCMNDYKTSRKYSEKCIELPPDLRKVMRFYLQFSQNEYLLTRNDGEPMTRNSISQALIKTFVKRTGRSVSTNLIRKIYLSSKFSQYKIPPEIQKEMEKDAHVMCHSVAVQQKIYTKFDPVIKEEQKNDVVAQEA